MSEKIAVHCKTEDEWDKVRERVGTQMSPVWNIASKQHKDICLYEDGQWDRREYCISKWRCKVISAEDYLKEGGEEFKVGDRVEVTAQRSGVNYIGQQGIVLQKDLKIDRIDYEIEFASGNTWWHYEDQIKLVNNQTKTTKKEESNMESTRINEIVIEVFEKKEDMLVVNDHLGGEIEEIFEECVNLGVIWVTENKVAVLKRANDMQAEKEAQQKSCP